MSDMMEMRMRLRTAATWERTDCLVNLRIWKKPDKVKQDLHQRLLQQNKCKSTGIRTTLFRSWCPQCVAGRAKSWPQFRQEEGDDGGVQAICFYCCLLREQPGTESVPVIVCR